ncbi:MAG: NAD(P)-dependent oxidoreductase, partial [Candidatus Hermodarchaeota archaeon]
MKDKKSFSIKFSLKDGRSSDRTPTRRMLSDMKGMYLDEEALYRALKKGKIAGAGLDVLNMEPPSLHNPLLRLDNVVATPHAASATF